MRKINLKDNKGQVFSLDVMMALIIITVILGVSADAMDIVSYKAQDYSSRFSLERVTTDAADILIKSPGSPDDWENHNFSSDAVPGLAEKDVQSGKLTPNTLSYWKIAKLKNDYSNLIYGKILPDGSNSSMMIYPTNSSLSPLLIMNNKIPANASEVAVANRTVLCDFMYVNVVIGMNAHRNPAWPLEPGFEWEICPHSNLTGDIKHEQPDFKTGKPGWACHHFNITQKDLNSTDFYVITDPGSLSDNSARWIIDRPENMGYDERKFSSTPIIVNDKIAAVMGNDTETVLWFHILTNGDPKDSFDGYIVGVPKGAPIDQVNFNYLNPQPCFFVLQVWY